MTGQVMFKFSLPCSAYTAKVGAERPATTGFIRYGTRGSGDGPTVTPILTMGVWTSVGRFMPP